MIEFDACIIKNYKKMKDEVLHISTNKSNN